MGENLRGFSLVPEVRGALNLCATVWAVFYRWQECLYRLVERKLRRELNLTERLLREDDVRLKRRGAFPNHLVTHLVTSHLPRRAQTLRKWNFFFLGHFLCRVWQPGAFFSVWTKCK